MNFEIELAHKVAMNLIVDFQKLVNLELDFAKTMNLNLKMNGSNPDRSWGGFLLPIRIKNYRASLMCFNACC